EMQDSDVVETAESTSEYISSGLVFPVDPPGEVHQQLVELAFEERAIADTVERSIELEHVPHRLAVHRWVDVAEVPLGPRTLPVGMQVDLVGHQPQLLFREIEIHSREYHAVKGQVPGGEPWVLPLIGHRDDVGALEMEPVGVPPRDTLPTIRWGPLVVDPRLHR